MTHDRLTRWQDGLLVSIGLLLFLSIALCSLAGQSSHGSVEVIQQKLEDHMQENRDTYQRQEAVLGRMQHQMDKFSDQVSTLTEQAKATERTLDRMIEAGLAVAGTVGLLFLERILARIWKTKGEKGA